MFVCSFTVVLAPLKHEKPLISEGLQDKVIELIVLSSIAITLSAVTILLAVFFY